MARIALIGASGNVGTRILNELVSRNHQVTAIVRDPSKVPAGAGVTAARGDVADPAGLADVLKGHDAVVSSVRFLDTDPAALIGAVFMHLRKPLPLAAMSIFVLLFWLCLMYGFTLSDYATR